MRAAAVVLLLLLDLVNSQPSDPVIVHKDLVVRDDPRPLSSLVSEAAVVNEVSAVPSETNATQKKRRNVYDMAPSTGTNVDKIKDIELGPTSIVIATTKQGPVDSLKIHIELTDLQDNRALPPIDLFGLFLVVARGRYTVPFLKPERWYALSFTSENTVDGEVNVNKETRLIRTTSRQHNVTAPEDLYEVEVHRDLDGEINAEKIYITLKWRGAERFPNGEVYVTVKVQCGTSSTTENMILHPEEDSVTIEISMDVNYDLETLDPDLKKVLAHATPLKCHRLCWVSSLRTTSPSLAETFENVAVEQCQRIEGTEVTDYLRQMSRYTVEKRDSGYKLVVDTAIHENKEEGYVTLTAQNLAKVDSEPRKKTFSTGKSNGTFCLPLSSDSVYTVQYKYTKTKPFQYSNEEHFLVETPSNSENFTESSQPLVETTFELENRTVGENQVIQIPVVTLSRGGAFSTADVKMSIDPLCEENATATTVEFTDENLSKKFELTTVICSNFPQAKFCNETGVYPDCSPILCYSTEVSHEGVVYPSSESHCVNVTEQIPLNRSTHVRCCTALLLIVLEFLYL
ncbi:unnamed protein product [Cylicocyclus nassatus]|uniref:Uncharacterized protein n=1 Tax=Cylicocyclus nassatus TaxID=53992 RepID=A0AA36H4Q9_CYLNA|nr:unnamed protein product [Cylicocyclus nassatus]